MNKIENIDTIKARYEHYSSLSTFERFSLAIQIQRNQILQNNLVEINQNLDEISTALFDILNSS